MAYKSGKQLVQEHKDAQKVRADLYEESVTISGNVTRYTELTCPGGLLRQAEQRVEAARSRLRAHVERTYGENSWSFKDRI